MDDGELLIRLGLGLVILVPFGIGLGYWEQRQEKKRWGKTLRGPDEECRDPYNRRECLLSKNAKPLGPYR